MAGTVSVGQSADGKLPGMRVRAALPAVPGLIPFGGGVPLLNDGHMVVPRALMVQPQHRMMRWPLMGLEFFSMPRLVMSDNDGRQRIVSIVSTGQMRPAIGARLQTNGVPVITPDGHSGASAARALAAGIEIAPLAEIGDRVVHAADRAGQVFPILAQPKYPAFAYDLRVSAAVRTIPRSHSCRGSVLTRGCHTIRMWKPCNSDGARTMRK